MTVSQTFFIIQLSLIQTFNEHANSQPGTSNESLCGKRKISKQKWQEYYVINHENPLNYEETFNLEKINGGGIKN